MTDKPKTTQDSYLRDIKATLVKYRTSDVLVEASKEFGKGADIDVFLNSFDAIIKNETVAEKRNFITAFVGSNTNEKNQPTSKFYALMQIRNNDVTDLLAKYAN